MKTVSLHEVIEKAKRKTEVSILAAGSFVKDKRIGFNRVNILGLELTGFLEYMNPDRIQVLDAAGVKFLKTLRGRDMLENLSEFFSHPIPALVLTDGIELFEDIKNLAEANGVPVLGSGESKWNFIRAFEGELEKLLAPRADVRGTVMDVFGVGVLIEGKSNVGKSECAIDLLKRGHRLVGDDVVDVSCRGSDVLLARGKYPIANRMELRGLGIIDIRELMGIAAVKDIAKIDLIVGLEKWQPGKNYERLGIEEKKKEILGVEVAYVEIPVAPGRNTAILVEVAVMNQNLRRRGIVPARQLDREVIESFKDEHRRD